MKKIFLLLPTLFVFNLVSAQSSLPVCGGTGGPDCSVEQNLVLCRDAVALGGTLSDSLRGCSGLTYQIQKFIKSSRDKYVSEQMDNLQKRYPNCKLLTTSMWKGMSWNSIISDEAGRLNYFFLKNNYAQFKMTGSVQDEEWMFYYGDATYSAMKKFQIANNITPTGNLGPKTLAKINSMICK